MDLDYHALAPEMVVAATILVVLGLDVALPRSRKYWTAFAGVLGLALAAVPLVTLAFGGGPGSRSLLGGAYVVDDFALVLKAVFIVGGYLVLLMSVSYIEGDRYYQGEYYLLLLTSILGSLIMASSRDLITIFVGLELVTGPLFLLAGWRKGDARSNEASLKFFILGVLSTAILLYGMSFLYGLTGSVTFEGIRTAGADLLDSGAFRLAVLFTLVGFGFKITAVPFHFWAPDTYEGAPTPVTAYLSVGSKVAGFVGLLLLCYKAFPSVTEIWGPALWVLAALSMTLGNLTALRQDNIVRMLAYSSIAQGGFILVPFAAAAVTNDPQVIQEAASATIVYVIIYAFMEPGRLRGGYSGRPPYRHGHDRRLGRNVALRTPHSDPGRHLLLLPGRDPAPGRLVRQVRHVPRHPPPRQPVVHGPGGDSCGQRGDRPRVLRKGRQDHVDGPPPRGQPRPGTADPPAERFPGPGPRHLRSLRDRGRSPALPAGGRLRRRGQSHHRRHLTIHLRRALPGNAPP